VKAPAGGDDARQEGVLESGISGPVTVDLGASGALEDPAGLRVAEGSISAHVSQMISAEFVVDCDVDDQVAAATEVDDVDFEGCLPLSVDQGWLAVEGSKQLRTPCRAVLEPSGALHEVGHRIHEVLGGFLGPGLGHA